ncbi:hypothetical protein TYRP_003028 [Tyrophagus putrescentiae]|nr:hypothetical protein TYRP_003028 [Tyrophagus putrescentiae]
MVFIGAVVFLFGFLLGLFCVYLLYWSRKMKQLQRGAKEISRQVASPQLTEATVEMDRIMAELRDSLSESAVMHEEMMKRVRCRCVVCSLSSSPNEDGSGNNRPNIEVNTEVDAASIGEMSAASSCSFIAVLDSA